MSEWQPHSRIHTPEGNVVVSLEAVQNGDDFRLVESNACFVEMLLEGSVAPEEISADATRCYCLSEFARQIDNGGFLQYVYNSKLDPLAVERLTEGLQRIGAVSTLEVYLAGIEQWEKMQFDHREAFLRGDFFGDDLLSDQFGRINQALQKARDEEELIDLAAQWLKKLPHLKLVSERSFEGEVKKRVSEIDE
jgi:hypothetical protein